MSSFDEQKIITIGTLTEKLKLLSESIQTANKNKFEFNTTITAKIAGINDIISLIIKRFQKIFIKTHLCLNR
jgi:hypothetical protein